MGWSKFKRSWKKALGGLDPGAGKREEGRAMMRQQEAAQAEAAQRGKLAQADIYGQESKMKKRKRVKQKMGRRSLMSGASAGTTGTLGGGAVAQSGNTTLG